MILILIMIGSGVGAVLRHMTNQIISKFFTQSFPFATLIVNVVGSFIIGLSAQYIAESSHIYSILAIGFCGGYTTFSTHILEVYERYLLKSYKQMILYIALTVILSLTACYLGYII